MQLKQRRRYVVVFVILFLVVSVGVSGYLWGRSLVSSRAPSPTHLNKAHPSPEVTPTPPVNIAADAHLVIPKIGVDAPVEPVHVEADGALGVPTRNQWDGVGWYQGGPIPGQRGSAIIDGHLDRPHTAQGDAVRRASRRAQARAPGVRRDPCTATRGAGASATTIRGGPRHARP